MHGCSEDGLIGGRDGDRHPSHDRRGLADRVGRLIAGLARIVGDIGLAEDLAQDALVAALEQWPESGVPDNPAAWLMGTAKHRAIDQLRRRQMLERKHHELAYDLELEQKLARPDPVAALDDRGFRRDRAGETCDRTKCSRLVLSTLSRTSLHSNDSGEAVVGRSHRA